MSFRVCEESLFLTLQMLRCLSMTVSVHCHSAPSHLYHPERSEGSSNGLHQSTNSNTGNTATIQQFLANFPPDSVLNGNEWSNKYLPNIDGGLFSFQDGLSRLLRDNFHYPKEKSQTYANMILMKYVFNTGVDLYVKGDDGAMHKLDILLNKDADNNLIVQVQICN